MLLISYYCFAMVMLSAPTARGFLVPYTLGDTTIMIDASEMPAMPSPLRQHIMGGLADRLSKKPVSVKYSPVHNILPAPNSEEKQALFGSEDDIPVYHINREILQYRSDLQYPASGSVELNTGDLEDQTIPIENAFDLSSEGKYVEEKADALATGISYDFVGDGQGNVQVKVIIPNRYQSTNSNPVNGNGLPDSDSLRRKTRKPIQTVDEKHSYNELKIRTTDPPPSLVSLTVTPNIFGEMNREHVNREYSGVSVKHLVQDQLNHGHGNGETMEDVYVNLDPDFEPSVASRSDASQILDEITHESTRFKENNEVPKVSETSSHLVGNFQDESVVEPDLDRDYNSPDFFDGTAIRNRESVNYFPTRPSSQNNHLISGLSAVKRDAPTGPNNYNVYDYTTIEDFQKVIPFDIDDNKLNHFEPEMLLANPTLTNKQSNRHSTNQEKVFNNKPQFVHSLGDDITRNGIPSGNIVLSKAGVVDNHSEEKSHFVSIDNFLHNKKESFYKPAVQKGDKHEVHLPASFIEKINSRKDYDSDLTETNNFTNEDHSAVNLANFNSQAQMQKRLADFNNAVFSAKVGDPVLSEEKREKSAQNAAVFEQSEAGKNPRFSLTPSHGIAIDSLEELRLINDVRQIVASLKQDEEFSPSFQSSHVLLANAMSYPDDTNHFTYKQEDDSNVMDFSEAETKTDNRIQTKLMQLLLHSAAGQASKDRLAAGGHYLSDGQLHNLQALITGQSLLSGQSPTTGGISTLTVSPSVQNQPETSFLRPHVPEPQVQSSERPFGGLSFVEQFVEDQVSPEEHLKELSTVFQQLIPGSQEKEQLPPDQSRLQDLLTKQSGYLKPLSSQLESQKPMASGTASKKITIESNILNPGKNQSLSQKPMAAESVTQISSTSVAGSQKPQLNESGLQQSAAGQTKPNQPTDEQTGVQETSSIRPFSGSFKETTAIVDQALQAVATSPMKDVLVEYGGSLFAASADLMDKGTCRCGLRFAQKVVGGNAASISEFPWLAGLARTENDFVFCGASFVSDRHLVTAAHCVHGFTPSAIYVRAGEARREGPATRLAVKAIRLHDRYDPYEKDYDIAVVTLENPVEFSPSVMPICLPSHDSPAEVFRSGVVAGWGRTRDRGNLSSSLQAATVDLLTSEQCKDQSSYKEYELNDRVFCARAPNKDACQGDSGGPLMVANGNNIEMIGLVSWGVGCADERYPGIYTKVSLYRTWIKASTRTGSKCSNVPIGDVQTSRASVGGGGGNLDQRLGHNIPRVPVPLGALTAYLFPVLKASFNNQLNKRLQDKVVIGSTSDNVLKQEEESVPTEGTDSSMIVADDSLARSGTVPRSDLSSDDNFSTDRAPLESETTVVSTDSSLLESETTIIPTEGSPLKSQSTTVTADSFSIEQQTAVELLESSSVKPVGSSVTESDKKSDTKEVYTGDNMHEKTPNDYSDVITMHDITIADPKFNFTLEFEDVNVNKEDKVQRPNETTSSQVITTEMYPGDSLATISDYVEPSMVPVRKNFTKLDIDSIEAIVQAYPGESSERAPPRGCLIQVTRPQNGASIFTTEKSTISDSNAAGSVQPMVAQTATRKNETSKPIIGNGIRENGTIVVQLDNIVLADPSFNFTLDFDNSSKSVGSTPAATATGASNQKRANGTILVEMQNITISPPNFNFTLDFDAIQPTPQVDGQAIGQNESPRKNASSDALILLQDITIGSPGFNFTLNHKDVPKIKNHSLSTNNKIPIPQNGTLIFAASNLTFGDPNFRFFLDFDDLTADKAGGIVGSELKTRDSVRSTAGNLKKMHSVPDLDTSESIIRDLDTSKPIIRDLDTSKPIIRDLDTSTPIIREKGDKISGGLLQNFSGMIIDSIHKLDSYLDLGNIIWNEESKEDSTNEEAAVKEGHSAGSNFNRNESSSNQKHSTDRMKNTTTQIKTIGDKGVNSTDELSADQLNEGAVRDQPTKSAKDDRDNRPRNDVKDINAKIAKVQSQDAENGRPFYRRFQDTLFGGWTGGGDARVRINDKMRTERKPEDDLNDAFNKIFQHLNS